jgi:O-antigen ligase
LGFALVLNFALVPFAWFDVKSGQLSTKILQALVLCLACANWRLYAERVPKVVVGFAFFQLVQLVEGICLEPRYQAEFLLQFGRISEMILLFIVTYRVFSINPKMQRIALGVLAASCVLKAALMDFGILGGTYKKTLRMSTFGQDPNTVGSVLVIGLIIITGVMLTTTRWRWRIVSIPAVVILLQAILQTGSRGAMVSLAVGMMVFCATSLTRGTVIQRSVTLLFMMMLLAGSLSLVSKSNELVNRWEAVIQGGNLAGREQIYPRALSMFLDRPIQGWGPIRCLYELNDQVPLFGMVREGTLSAHNLFLQMLLEVGLLGTIPYLWSMWGCLKKSAHSFQPGSSVLPLALMLVLISVNMSIVWQISSLHWYIMAIAAAARNSELLPKRKVYA